MRELERIDRICDLLKEKWKRYPDLRLGQFLMNYVFGNTGGRHTAYIFYGEDDKTEEALKNLDKLREVCDLCEGYGLIFGESALMCTKCRGKGMFLK